MADPASLALGIIPLVGVVVKSYSAVYKKLSTFVHYSAKVKRIQKRFKFQRRIFENECHLLLRFAISDDATINSMRTDPDHENWSSDNIDNDLRKQLGANYKPCLDLVQDIQRALNWVEDQLKSFDILEKYQLRGEALKQTLKRLEGQITITFNESNYEKAIMEIKNANTDLGTLREQISALANLSPDQEAPIPAQTFPRTSSSGRTRISDATPGWNTLCKVRRASNALYGALAEVWSCQEVSHTRHLVKLAIEPEGRPAIRSLAVGEISMDMAVLCFARKLDPVCKPRLLPLVVKSQILPRERSAIERSLSTRTFQTSNIAVSVHSSALKSSDTRECEIRPKKRAKIVRFFQGGSGTSSQGNPSSRTSTAIITQGPVQVEAGGLEHMEGGVDSVETGTPDTKTGDLRSSKDICSHLARVGPNSQHQRSQDPNTESVNPNCIGYIDIQGDEIYRHSFHHKEDPLRNMMSYDGSIQEDDILSLDSLLNLDKDEVIPLTVVDKLRLARSLVRAVLQYHSTPWMKELWTLGDLSFFRHGFQDHNLLSSPIKSLYLGVEFSKGACQPQPIEGHGTSNLPARRTICPPQRSAYSEQISECQLVYGVTNITLHSLGAALLQIDQWSSTGNIKPQDVPTIRKLALRHSSLGPRFDDIIRRCIQCNFNYGFDLNRPQMQKDVYEKLVTPLEHMIASMSLEDEADDRNG